jgi:hypothetical protein
VAKEEKSIAEVVSEYHSLNSEKKALEKDLEPLNARIKEHLGEEAGEETFETEQGKIQVKLAIQDRSTMNPEKLVLKLKELGFHQAIKTVEVPDAQAVEMLMFEGRIPAAELDSCREPKFVRVLTTKLVLEKLKKGGKK